MKKSIAAITLSSLASISYANAQYVWDGEQSVVVQTDRSAYSIDIKGLDHSQVAYTLDGQILTFINLNNGQSLSVQEPGEDNLLNFLQAVSFNDVPRTQWSRNKVFYNVACVSRYDAEATEGNDYIEDAIDEPCYSRDYTAIFNNMFVYALAGDDYILGNNGNDQIIGGDDNDTVYGDSGDDRIYGGNGSDYLYGNSGNDLLVGGAGSDDIYGGAGNDEYVFSADFGRDYVYESAGENDVVRLLDYRARDVSISRVGDDLEIYVNRDTYLLVRGHYAAADYAIEKIEFSKGKTLIAGIDF